MSKAVFDEKTGQWAIENAQEPSQQIAEMNMGVRDAISKVTDLKIFGVPIGGPVLGGATAIAIDRVLLNKVDPEHKYAPWSLLAAALVIGKFGGKLSPEWARWTAGILVYEAAADTITSLLERYWPNPAEAEQPMAQRMSQPMAQPAPMSQFPSTAGDYYAKAFARN